MAKPDEKQTKASTEGEKSKTGLYAIAALAVAVIFAGFYFLSADAAPDPDKPKMDPEMAAIMEAGPLEDIVLGDPDADTIIVEYASMTCPHCAHFYKEIFPDVKKKYIDTGKARFIFREFPLDGLAVAASMLARCSGNDRFYPMLEGLFETMRVMTP